MIRTSMCLRQLGQPYRSAVSTLTGYTCCRLHWVFCGLKADTHTLQATLLSHARTLSWQRSARWEAGAVWNTITCPPGTAFLSSPSFPILGPLVEMLPTVLLPRWVVATAHTDHSFLSLLPRTGPSCLSGSAPTARLPMTQLPLSWPWWKPCRGS
jgi:hypothetical protein